VIESFACPPIFRADAQFESCRAELLQYPLGRRRRHLWGRDVPPSLREQYRPDQYGAHHPRPKGKNNGHGDADAAAHTPSIPAAASPATAPRIPYPMDPTPIRIRPAAITDAPLIHTLITVLADYEKLAHAVVATDECIRRHLFGNPAQGGRAAEAIIGELDGTPQGFALFFTTYSTFVGKPGIYLEDLYVRPDARGRGLGKALFAHLAAIAHARGCGRLEWSVLNWNQPAIGFYTKLGAVPMNQWTVYRLDGEALERVAGK